MSCEELLREGRIRRHATSGEDIAAGLTIAQARLGDAGIDGLSADGRFIFAYDAARSAAEAVMAAEGYRPVAGVGHHETVFAFLRFAVDGRWAKRAAEFDQARVKRNSAEYDEWGLVTHSEADDLLLAAREFVAEVARWLSTRIAEGASPSADE